MATGMATSPMLGGVRPSATDHELTVIIPAYNEEQRLPQTLAGLSDYLNDWGIDYRVLVIDNNSSDATGECTDRYDRRYSTIRQPRPGKGAAVRLGMLAATGKVIAFTDADLPYQLDSLRSGFESIRSRQCDVVYGARDLAGSEYKVRRKLLRTLATTAFREIVRCLVSREVTDTQCGLKLFRRDAAVEIFSRTTIDGFAFDAEVVFLARQLGYRHLRIPVTLINEYSSTLSLSRHALPMLMDVFQLRWRSLRGAYRLGANRPALIAIEDRTERKAA